MRDIGVLYRFPLRLGTLSSSNPMTAWHQVVGLVAQGVRVLLYCGSCEKPIAGLNGLKETLVPWGVKVPIRLLGMYRAASLHDRIVAKALRRLNKGIDIVHCWPSGALETLKTARKLGIETVLERPSAHTHLVYEVTSRECKKLGIKLSKSHYTAFNEKILAREEREFATADRLLCPSEFVVKTFLREGFPKNRLCQHQYGYDPEVLSPYDRSNSNATDGSFSIVYVGDCHPLKGLHFALRAWVASQASKEGRFYICGRFMPEYRELLQDSLSHSSVEYLGFTPDAGKVMRRCDALVLPSLAEGSAIVTYEARACGCVLLVSDAAGAVCEHMKDGLIHKSGDTNTLRDHIDLLASDKNLRERLQANSLAGVASLTWTEAAKKLVKIYQECFSEEKPI
jgi:glycosyltransferase involved in cell wall biosynthesis